MTGKKTARAARKNSRLFNSLLEHYDAHNLHGQNFTRILSNIEESHSLFTLRDALLPKLLSGELRVPISELDQL